MFRTYLFLLLFSCSVMSNSMDCSMLGFPDLHNLPEFAQTHVHWVDDAIQPYHPLPAPSPLALNLSQHQSLFQWVDFLHQVAKVLELQLQLSISPSSEYSGLISFRIEWLDILAVQGTLNSLLQLHSSKASILRCSAFFLVQLSHLYCETESCLVMSDSSLPIVHGILQARIL